MATVELQYGVDGFTRRSGHVLSASGIRTNYGVAPADQRAFAQRLQRAAALQPGQRAAAGPDGGIHGAALSLQVLADGNGNAIYVQRLQAQPSVERAQATWNEATSGQSWGQPGANAVPADREAGRWTAASSWVQGVRRGLDLTSAVSGWVSAPSSNYGVVLRSDSRSVQYDLGSADNGHPATGPSCWSSIRWPRARRRKRPPRRRR